MAGPSITLANQRSHVRLLIIDTSSTSPAISDANINILLNKNLLSYASIMVGDEVLSRVWSGVTLTAGNNSATQTFSGHAPLNVQAVYLSGVKKLAKKPLHEVVGYQHEHPDETGEPTCYAVYAALTRDAWAIYFDKKADQNYTVNVWTNHEPIQYAADSDTTPLGDHAAYVIATMAALEAARIIGRPEGFIDRIAAHLPESIRSAMGVAFMGTTFGGASHARSA